MKPSLTVQTTLPSLNYKFIERLNVISDNSHFNPESLISSFSFIRFHCTLNKFFTSEFLEIFLIHPFLIKSIRPFSELSGMSLTIDKNGEMLLTLSRSLDQATGLDASKPLVDSAHFDSSTNLLHFNLIELKKQKKKLERIRNLSNSILERQEYSCEFVAVIETEKSENVLKVLSKLNISASIDELLRPKITTYPISKSHPWPIRDEFDLKDRLEVLNLFDWIGTSLQGIENTENDLEFFLTDTCKHFCIEGALLPQIDLEPLLQTSTRFIGSLKCCKRIPPPFELNLQRLKHFNERKFDGTACTADQMALIIFKSPLQTLYFQLNTAT